VVHIVVHFHGDFVNSTVILALRKQKQSKPSSLALGGLEFVIFLLKNVLLFIDQAAQNFGEKNSCSRVVKNAIFNKKFRQRSVKITTNLFCF